MKTPVCRLEYHKFGSSELDTFSQEVQNGIYTNPAVFPTPPFTEADFIAAQEDFGATAADYVQYGITKKVAFLESRELFIKILDESATYVDSIAGGNISTIALSGFVPTSDVAQPAPSLGKIETFKISLTNVTGEILIEIPAYSNQIGINYFCVCVDGKPLENAAIVNGRLAFSPADGKVKIDFTRSRQKRFTELTPGNKYYFYVFASNTSGVSPISSEKSIYAN